MDSTENLGWNLLRKWKNRAKAIMTGMTSVILVSSVSQRGNCSKGWRLSELFLVIKVLEIYNHLHFQLHEVPITWRIMGRWRWLLWTKVCQSVDNICINHQFFMHHPKWYNDINTSGAPLTTLAHMGKAIASMTQIVRGMATIRAVNLA